jgi:pyoverdine/dityrosine biosynthesis protein Dit1
VDEIETAVQQQFPSVTRVYVRPHEDAGLKFGKDRGRIK